MLQRMMIVKIIDEAKLVFIMFKDSKMLHFAVEDF